MIDTVVIIDNPTIPAMYESQISPDAELICVMASWQDGKHGIIVSTSHGVVSDETWKCSKIQDDSEDYCALDYDDSSWQYSVEITNSSLVPVVHTMSNLSSLARWIWANDLSNPEDRSSVVCRRSLKGL